MNYCQKVNQFKVKVHFILLLVLCILIGSLSGCAIKRSDSAQKLTKIADHLYEITFTDDFDFEQNEGLDFSMFACSGIQNGQYRGRNYDLYYADSDICVIYSCVSENRPHASVGVADLSYIDDGSKTYNTDLIPFVTVDGLNDAGVCIQINVIPYGENGVLNHTESTDDDLMFNNVVRYVLDNAASVDEAISLLKAKDIYSEIDTSFEVHWMISGAASNTDKTTKTVVIEVFPDGLHVSEDFVDDKPIMTNFNIYNFDGSVESIGIGSGFERWRILNENFDQANSVMGTFDLMEKVFYSKSYDLYSDRFWYSDLNGTDLSLCYEIDELKALLGEDVYDYYMENYGGVYYNPELFDGEEALKGDISKAGILSAVIEIVDEYYKAQNQEDGIVWITIHTAVYDLENLTLDIQVRESQDHYHFTIE